MRCWAKLTMAWGFLWIWLISNTYQCNIYIFLLYIIIIIVIITIIIYY
jgi:hypothetical protein